ncbi:MAG: hypothetical protein IPL61_10770 [Myxococcales bacterium]|nr:hypothetical protein [Myxococcales bacterium]
MTEDARQLLAELLTELGARRASIVPAGGASPPGGVGGLRSLPLGGGARLEVELGAIGRATDDVDRALEEAVRALRELARATARPWPALTTTGAGPMRVRDRIRTYLAALAELHGARVALVCVRDRVVVANVEPDLQDRERLPLLVRRLEAAGLRQGSSHGELADDDVFALSFWHRAAVVVFFAGPYPIDFVRHRARLVAREVAELLADLEPDPGAPAMAQRRPE